MSHRSRAFDIGSSARRDLERWIRAGTTPQRVVKRARIVLLAAEGHSSRAIARMMGISPHTASLWRDRYQQRGPHSLLTDAPGRGRTPTATSARQVAQVRRLLENPPLHSDRWTVRALAHATGLSRASISRILRAIDAEGRAVTGPQRGRQKSSDSTGPHLS